ncbi:substrate-binding domain-containing protein, partial [Caldilinea sp.]|uniref:substrate-binding domain-containing protein n=1 Tax=Caldilinea sp. TaxID=2293560 RepID=UPI002BE93028|nr:substrate-binding domain-containing protein [Caldilinea sp.]
MTFPLIRVGFGLLPGDPFWVLVREAVQQRAETLGLLLIPVTLPGPDASSEVHLRFLDDLKAQEIDALISHVFGAAHLLAIINTGIPVICSEDMALTHPSLVSVHGLDRAAVMAAEYIVKRLGAAGTILMVGAADDHVLTAQLRVQGFYGVTTHYPGLRTLHVGDGWRYEMAYQQLLHEADRWTSQVGGRIDAVFGLSDSLALAGRDACRKLGIIDDKTIIVGINGDPLAIAAIEAGTMDASVETSAQDLGYKLAEYAYRAAVGEALPDHFPYAFELVTAANVAQVATRKLVFIADLPSRLVDVNRRLEQQRLVQLEASLELNQRVGQILDQDELLTTMTEIIGARYTYDRIHFYLWSHSDRTLTRMERTGAEHTSAIIPLAASGPLGHALMNNQGVYIPDTVSSQRYAPDPHWPDVRSRVILPVRIGGRILGVLDLHSQNRAVRNQVELDALQTLANELGAAMRNAQLYAQALKARAEAVQASLLRSRLLANVSHQLRSPLNVILGYCQAAQTTPNPYGAPLPAELLHDLSYIERSGADLERLINDLLDLALAETGALRIFPETIDLRPLLVGVFEAAGRAFGESNDVRWRLHAPTHLPAIHADPVRLRHVLMNLLNNAARCTERGQIVLGAVCLETQVHLWIQDTGCGMTAETLARVRQHRLSGWAHPPHSLDNQDGLGLTIAQHLVELHNGKFTIESEPGHGTTCHLFLPWTHDAPSAAQTMASHPVGARQRSDPLTQQFVEQIRKFVAENYTTPLTRE